MNKKTARKALDRTIRITRVAWVGAVSILILAMAEAILIEESILQCIRIVILVSSGVIMGTELALPIFDPTKDSKQKGGDEDTCATTKE